MLNPDDPGWEDVETFQAQFNTLSASEDFTVRVGEFLRISGVSGEEKIYFCGCAKLDAYKLCSPLLGKIN